VNDTVCTKTIIYYRLFKVQNSARSSIADAMNLSRRQR